MALNCSRRDRKDLRTYPVQETPCRTCPFAGKEPLPLPLSSLAGYLSNLTTSQHLCHSYEDGKSSICRGFRDIQLRVLCSLGFLPEPTDEAFNKALDYYLGGKNDE